MRKIKFRAWDKKRKKIFEVMNLDLRFPTPRGVFIGVTDMRRGIFSGPRIEYVDINDVEMMQFTGLKDKNDKEIYEGDILELYNHHQVEVIEYEGSAFGVFEHTNSSRESGRFTNLDEWADNAMEVIGNIYEHPELIKR